MWALPDTYAVPMRHHKPGVRKATIRANDPEMCDRILRRLNRRETRCYLINDCGRVLPVYEGTDRYDVYAKSRRAKNIIGHYDANADSAQMVDDIREFFA